MTTKRISLVVVLLIIVGIYFLVGRNPDPEIAQPLKIGAALPLTGAVASFGEEFQRGAEVAAEEINKNGNLVKVIFEDTALDPRKAADAVTKLVNSDDIDAIFVSAYSEAAASHQITDQKNIPNLVLWDSNPQLEAMGNKVFALGPWTPASGEVTAEFAYSRNLKRVAIFGYKQEWSSAVSDSFRDKFISLGGVITISEFSNPGASDYRTELSKIIKTNPDAVYMTVEDFLRGVIQIRNLGYKGVIITSDLLDNSQIADQPSLLEGIYGSQVADPETTGASNFTEMYEKKFGEKPKKILYGTWGYDAVHLLYKASLDKDIISGLYNLDYQGASGHVNFDSNGSSKTIPKMFVVRNGLIDKIK